MCPFLKAFQATTKKQKRKRRKGGSQYFPGTCSFLPGQQKFLLRPPLSWPEGFPPLPSCRVLPPSAALAISLPLAWGEFLCHLIPPTWSADWSSSSLGTGVLNLLLSSHCWILQLADFRLSFSSMSPWPRACPYPFSGFLHPLTTASFLPVPVQLGPPLTARMISASSMLAGFLLKAIIIPFSELQRFWP